MSTHPLDREPLDRDPDARDPDGPAPDALVPGDRAPGDRAPDDLDPQGLVRRVAAARRRALDGDGVVLGDARGTDGALAEVTAPAGHLVVATSGSTGAPRLVVRTTASWEDCAPSVDTALGLRPDDVVWAPGPAASSLTLFAVWHALAARRAVLATGAWRPALRRRAIAAAAQAGASVLQAVPAVAADVVEARAAGLLPSLRLVVVAGAATSPALRRRAEAAGLACVEYYGAAELSFAGVDVDGRGLVPFPQVTWSLREGVLWVRSPWTARHPGSPAGPWRTDVDGFHTVGDRAEVLPDGRLRVRGRGVLSAEVGGHTVDLSAVEARLAAVDEVAEVVCAALPHDRLGACVGLLVRARAGVARADLDAALRRAARDLPPASRPVRRLVVDDVPRGPGGKVDRAAAARLLILAGAGDRGGAGVTPAPRAPVAAGASVVAASS